MKRPSKDECLRWLAQAQDEWADADELRKRTRHYLALFHFQQAAEKALEAYLYMQSQSVEVFRTHSVDELGRTAADQTVCPAVSPHGTMMIRRNRSGPCVSPRSS